jgi:hypothetical protein
VFPFFFEFMMVVIAGWIQQYWNVMHDIVACSITGGLGYESGFDKAFYDTRFKPAYEMVLAEVDSVNMYWFPGWHYGAIAFIWMFSLGYLNPYFPFIGIGFM